MLVREEVWEAQERNGKLPLLQVRHQDLAWRLDRQIGSFPIENKAEGVSPGLIGAEG